MGLYHPVFVGIFTINELGNALLTSQCKGILVGYSWDMNRNGDIQYWDIIWSVITHTHTVSQLAGKSSN